MNTSGDDVHLGWNDNLIAILGRIVLKYQGDFQKL